MVPISHKQNRIVKLVVWLACSAQAEFGYKNFWFVNASLRNDWSSTLPKGKNSFFYGGVNTSLIITDLFEDLKSDALNFLKVRAAWGKTGNDADPYATSAYYIPTQISMGFGDLYLPLNGAMGMTEYNRLPNTNLNRRHDGVGTGYDFPFVEQSY